MEISEASKRIAEASQKDNTAMRALAEDSRTVALAAARDSAAMRVIAAVTILFLPATFTAVSLASRYFRSTSSIHHYFIPPHELHAMLTLFVLSDSLSTGRPPERFPQHAADVSMCWLAP
jgi:hypothetical protein